MNLLFISFFVTLVATSTGTKCNCTTGSADCKDLTCIIDNGGWCVSVAYKTDETAPELSQYRACQNTTAKFNVCQENYMFINTEKNAFYLKSGTKCCQTDLCNKQNISVPKQDDALSGRACPSCYADDSSQCKTAMLNCTKSQTRCINMTGNVLLVKGGKPQPFVVKGCATPSAEVLKKGAELHLGEATYSIENSTTRHNNAGRPLESIAVAILIPSFFALLLNKSQN